MLRILQNVAKGMKYCIIKMWKPFLDMLIAMCRFLSTKGSCETMIERCYFSGGPWGKSISGLIEDFNHLVCVDSWGTVAIATVKILEVKDVLQLGRN